MFGIKRKEKVNVTESLMNELDVPKKYRKEKYFKMIADDLFDEERPINYAYLASRSNDFRNQEGIALLVLTEKRIIMALDVIRTFAGNKAVIMESTIESLSLDRITSVDFSKHQLNIIAGAKEYEFTLNFSSRKDEEAIPVFAKSMKERIPNL